MSSTKSKKLGFSSLVLLIVANTIGTGIFSSTGYSLASLNNQHSVLLAWVLGALYSLGGVYLYSIIVHSFKESGGEYAILSRYVHPLPGFLSGWISAFAGFTGPIALAAQAFDAYSGLPSGIPWGAFLILITGALFFLSQEIGIELQNAMVALKILALILLIALATFLGLNETPVILQSEAIRAWPFFETLIWILFAYSGWNAAIYVYEDIAEPKEQSISAGLIAVLLISVLYIGMNVAYLYFIPFEVLSGKPDFALAGAEYLGGKGLKYTLQIALTTSVATCVSSMIFIAPHVYLKILSDYSRRLRKPGPKTSALKKLVLAQVLLSLCVYFFSSFKEAVTAVGYLLSVSVALSGFAVYKIPKKSLKRPFLAKYIIAPSFILFTLGMALISAESSTKLFAFTSFFILTGILVWIFLARPRHYSVRK